jgi:glucokinase
MSDPVRVDGRLRMVGDLGGTHARLAILEPSGVLSRIEVLTCADYARVEDALAAYREKRAIRECAEVCLAVAGPVDRDRVDLPNNHWAFSRRELEAHLGAPLLVINDFTAQALSIDRLAPEELMWLGSPRPRSRGACGVLGPGTGLGVAIRTEEGEVIPSEGGHVGFAPASDHELDLLRILHRRFARVSFERILSGPGLENLYWANRILELGGEGGGEAGPSAPEIAALADGGDALALQSVRDFFGILATFAGDLALMAWAEAGIYLSGGVTRRLMRFLDVGRFRARFQDKGRFSHVCATIPVAWVRNEHPGLLGCAAALADHAGRAWPGSAPRTGASR